MVSHTARPTTHHWNFDKSDSGLTLIELLVAISILGVLATVMSTVLSGILQSQSWSTQQDELLDTANLAMERMVGHVKQANRLLLPLASKPTRDVLALGGFIDNDSDGRFDEDPPGDLTNDGVSGIIGIDDDDDGQVDESWPEDDDEGGFANEDLVNGTDNDGDGDIDEDPPGDLDFILFVTPWEPDDDEDGQTDEDPIEPIVYYLDTATNTLWERYPIDGATTTTTALAENVTTFQVQRLVLTSGVPLLDIILRLEDGQGHVVELRTQVFARNL